MQYPKLPPEEDKRRKLSSEQIEAMKQMHEDGMSYRAIAAIFNVSKTIVGYHCSDQDRRDEINKKRYELLCEQEARDLEFKLRRDAEKQKDNAELLKRSAAKRKYKGKATYRWKKKKYAGDLEFREKVKKQAREAYARKLKERICRK